MTQGSANTNGNGRTVRLSRAGLLCLVVAAPVMIAPAFCSVAIADPKAEGKAPAAATKTAAPAEPGDKAFEESGGTVLLYEVDVEKPDDALMERIVTALANRLKTTQPGSNRSTVGRFLDRLSASAAPRVSVRRVGKNQVEIRVPGSDAVLVEQTKRRIAALGTMEFAILANRRDVHSFDFDRVLRDKRKTVVIDGEVVAVWREVSLKIDVQGKQQPGQFGFDPRDEIALRPVEGKPEGYVEVLVVNEPNADRRITGKLLKSAFPTNDQSGGPAIGFTFNEKGGQLLSDLTTANKPLRDGFKRRLAILLDGKVVTAPSIRSAIGESGIIEGTFTRAEVDETIELLNAGALPAPIKKAPLKEYTVVPRAGPKAESSRKAP